MPNTGESSRNRTAKNQKSKGILKSAPVVRKAKESAEKVLAAKEGAKQMIEGLYKDREIKREIEKYSKLDREAQRDKLRRVLFVLVQFMLIYSPTRSEFEHLLPYFGRPHRNWSAQSRKRFFDATGPQRNFYCMPDGTCTPVNPNVASTTFGNQMMFSRGLNLWKNPALNMQPTFNSNMFLSSKVLGNSTRRNRKHSHFNPPPPKQFKNTGRK